MNVDIKDFFKLDFPYKFLLALTLVQIPFWYFSLYLFHRQFFISQTFYLQIAVVLCFSIIFALGSLISSYGFLAKPNKPKNEDAKFLLASWCFIWTIIKLSSFIYFGYCKHWTFMTFINFIGLTQLILSGLGGLRIIAISKDKFK